MKIAILNGSPRKENTAAMVNAFKAGAEEAGNEVCVLHVGRQHRFSHPLQVGACAEVIASIRSAYLIRDMPVYHKGGACDYV